ncbi:hypothetical protein ACF1D2_28500 [Streptomyces bacillaris]|uniref:hypothetical protein n=1 Tax=Streptomyces bacillaris TaxID=68179 RepID=UPI0036FCC376
MYRTKSGSKVCGHRLRVLEDPVRDGPALGDFVTGRRLPEDDVLGLVENDRVPSVLRALNPEERVVVELPSRRRGSEMTVRVDLKLQRGDAGHAAVEFPRGVDVVGGVAGVAASGVFFGV